MITIPSKETKQFAQPNTGDTGGNLWSTYGIDLTSNKGRIRSSRTLDVVDSLNVDFTTLKTPSAFAFFNPGGVYSSAKVFIAYGGRPWYGSSTPNTGWTNTTIGSNEPTSTTTDVDMKVYNDKLYATTSDSKLKRMATGGSWTDIASIGNGIHILETYANRLYWTQDNYKIFSIDTAESVASSSYTLQLTGRNGHISWMRGASNRIWIGWTSNDGSRGSIFEWDGQSENLYSKEYKIESQGSCTCVIKKDIPYVLDLEGRLLAFNGSNFQEVARLPVTNEEYPLLNTVQNSSQKLAHFNGSRIINNSMLFLINPILSKNGNNEGYLENCQPGIWEYEEKTGLFNKYTVSTSLISEDPVFDYGQGRLLTVGALFDGSVSETGITFDLTRQGNVLFGARSYRTTSISPYLIGIDNTLDDKSKSSYIITQWLESTQVEDVFKAIVVKYNRLLNTTDKIKVKYRTYKIDGQSVPISWTSTTTFTTAISAMGDYEVGDEVEVTLGAGSGKCVNISDISFAAGTYTVTVDEAVVGATGNANVKLQKWSKLQYIQNVKQFSNLPLPQYNKDTKIQFKIIMEFTGKNELEEIIVVNGTEQNAK
jgi:hypothetical protein